MRYPQAVLVSCEIPWDARERLDEPRFRREVQSALANGFRHVYVFGTAGEGYAVDGARFREVVELFREETRAPGVHPQVGVIGLSTARVVESIGTTTPRFRPSSATSAGRSGIRSSFTTTYRERSGSYRRRTTGG
jgi:hypothetical protein